jgi:hypothetical protein
LSTFTLTAAPFPKDTEVGAFPRVGDNFRPVEPEQTASPKDGVVCFEGLRDNAPYFAAPIEGPGPVIAFTAKADQVNQTSTEDKTTRRGANAQSQAEREAKAEMVREAPPEQLSSAPGKREIVTGPRNTTSLRQHTEQDSGVNRETPKEEVEAEPQPAGKQTDAFKNQAQRSATPFGAATPKPADEPQPKPRQEDVPEGAPQRSSTPHGEATPVDVEEEDRSEEPQRVEGDEGESFPKADAGPRGTPTNPSSKEQAAGVRSTTKQTKKSSKNPAPAAKEIRDTGEKRSTKGRKS